MNKQRKIGLVIILAVCLIIPVASAKRKTLVEVRTIPDFDDFEQYNYNEDMPNGFVDVDVCYKFEWYDLDMNYLGYAYQYITGIEKHDSGNDFSSLHGYGIFYSEIQGKEGTITYKIGNIWKPNEPAPNFDDDVYWGGHLKFYDGTDYFDGLKGQGELNFDEMLFELYLDYNPWE